jgi:hypothetical protein
MTEWYGIILANQLKAYPCSWPVAEEEGLQVLDDVKSLNHLVKNHYDRKQYMATLCDPKPDSRAYKIVGGFRTEMGAIYKLVKIPG